MDELVTFSLIFPLLWWSGLAALGLCMGSFLNVVISRLPAGLTSEEAASTHPFRLLIPPSHCMNCHAAIRWYDNFPLLSWLLLKGKCRCCGRAISLQYPLVEALSLGLSLMVGLVYPPDVALAGLLIFSWLLLALSVIDINTLLLPDSLTLTLLWMGLLFNLNSRFVALSEAVTGAAAGYVTLRLLGEVGRLIFQKSCLGYGDCKMTAGIAAWTGWQNLPVLLLLASTMGLVWLVAARLIGGKNIASPIPFGPSLAMAGWLIVMTTNH